ncbi:MAG: hypothetical protein AVDCRST_MAG30-1589, partial [uncultured Solirubrobacteraceae bacterium]
EVPADPALRAGARRRRRSGSRRRRRRQHRRRDERVGERRALRPRCGRLDLHPGRRRRGLDLAGRLGELRPGGDGPRRRGDRHLRARLRRAGLPADPPRLDLVGVAVARRPRHERTGRDGASRDGLPRAVRPRERQHPHAPLLPAGRRLVAELVRLRGRDRRCARHRLPPERLGRPLRALERQPRLPALLRRRAVERLVRHRRPDEHALRAIGHRPGRAPHGGLLPRPREGAVAASVRRRALRPLAVHGRRPPPGGDADRRRRPLRAHPPLRALGRERHRQDADRRRLVGVVGHGPHRGAGGLVARGTRGGRGTRGARGAGRAAESADRPGRRRLRAPRHRPLLHAARQCGQGLGLGSQARRSRQAARAEGRLLLPQGQAQGRPHGPQGAVPPGDPGGPRAGHLPGLRPHPLQAPGQAQARRQDRLQALRGLPV